MLVTGLPRKDGLDEKDFTPTTDEPALWRATALAAAAMVVGLAAAFVGGSE